MNKTDHHDPETFGSRTGKTAPEALLNLQLLFGHCRICKQPVGCTFNDTIGFYNRIQYVRLPFKKRMPERNSQVPHTNL